MDRHSSTRMVVSVGFLALLALTGPAETHAAVWTGNNKIGHNGRMGPGGAGGLGGKGGAGGYYDLEHKLVNGEPILVDWPGVFDYEYTQESLNRSKGKPGQAGQSGGRGGTGGAGGNGHLRLSSEFLNQGDMILGGVPGQPGGSGLAGASAGGVGGRGGAVQTVTIDDDLTLPVRWVPGYGGGPGGGKKGHAGHRHGYDGTDGGGGGGGTAGHVFGHIHGYSGGKGGDAAKGADGAGGDGLGGMSVGVIVSSPSGNSGLVQLGGDGGDGGQGGQGGSGGGGGGGAGGGSWNGYHWFLRTWEEGFVGGPGGAAGAGGVGGDGGAAGDGFLSIDAGGAFSNEAAGTVVVGRGAGGSGAIQVHPGGELTNSGQLTLNSNGRLDVAGGTATNNANGLIVNAGAIENHGTFTSNGVLDSRSGGAFTNAGTFKGVGAYLGDFDSGGVVAPGNSVGTMMIDGDFLFSDGQLEIEIGGFGAGQYDLLDITGQASLTGGTILFELWDNYDFSDIMPDQSKHLTFLAAVGGVSSFTSSIAFADGFLPAGYGYDVFSTGSGLDLEVWNGNRPDNPSVPAPGAVWLVGSGLLLLRLGERRRRNR